MKRVLFPFDFSESATNALNYASQYANKNNCELVLYNSHGVFERGYLEDTLKKLNAVAKDIGNTYNINCLAIVEPTAGGLSKHLNLTAATFDLVIMGTKGSDSFLQVFTGSNAYNAVLKANVPFLIIPLGFEETTVANFVYAYDYSKEKQLPIQQLLPFLESVIDKSLTVLRVVEIGAQASVESYIEDLSPQFKDVKNLDLKFESLYSSKSTADTIHQYMVARDTAVLCLCTKRRDFMEHLFHKSVIKEISVVANYPFFVFHH
jgi:nucleotide-binding universal stress UspA family protein